MSIITAINSQKNGKRVNIYLDGKFGFGIDLDNFVLLHLKVNQELSEKEIEEIVKKSDFQKNFEKVLRFAMVRPRSKKEFIDYFKRKKFDESIHRSIIDKLAKLKFIDDVVFAKWWVDSRIARGKSRRIMNYELRIKGIANDTIEKVLSEIEIDEVKMAKQLLQKKAYKWKGLDPRLAIQKKARFLIGKGFSWDVVEKLVKNVIE